MKRSGFTMIELIFVIVILGILASVAIPKLAATRDDAEISKIASNAATLVSDLGAFYTSQGVSVWTDTDTDWGDVTNVEVFSDAGLTVSAKGDDVTVDTVYMGAAGEDCLSFTTTDDGNLTISDAGGTTAICTAVTSEVADLIKTHQFGGIGIVRN